MLEFAQGVFIGVLFSSLVFATAVMVLYDLWQEQKANYNQLLKISLKEIARLKNENESYKKATGFHIRPALKVARGKNSEDSKLN